MGFWFIVFLVSEDYLGDFQYLGVDLTLAASEKGNFKSFFSSLGCSYRPASPGFISKTQLSLKLTTGKSGCDLRAFTYQTCWWRRVLHRCVSGGDPWRWNLWRAAPHAAPAQPPPFPSLPSGEQRPTLAYTAEAKLHPPRLLFSEVHSRNVLPLVWNFPDGNPGEGNNL